MAPDCEPVVAGEKVTLMAQVAPGPRLAPQLLLWAQLPLLLILAMLKFTLLGLLIVMVLAELVLLTPWEPK
jgi:hypothetical protein